MAKVGYPVWYSAQVVLFLTCNHVQCINATNLFNYYSPSIFSCSLVLSLFIYYLIDQSTLILPLLTSLSVHHREVHSWIIYLRYLLFISCFSLFSSLLVSLIQRLGITSDSMPCALSITLPDHSQSVPSLFITLILLKPKFPTSILLSCQLFSQVITIDGNVAIYRRYIVDISGIGPSKHDISKRKLNKGAIKKYQPIVQRSHVNLHFGFEIP